MKCPICVAKGLSSTVTSQGVTATLLAWSPFYDKRGIMHSHDINRRLEGFACSNGHAFEREFLLPCPQGDYPRLDSQKIRIRNGKS